MRCPNCQFECMEEDLYCRQCGADLEQPSTSVIPIHNSLPAVLHSPQLPRSVAAGVGALALGVGLELLRRGLLARLARSPHTVERALPIVEGLKDILQPHNDEKPLKIPKGYEVHETVVYMRRVVRRAN
ncbi:MAG TPA: hypothetical protein VKV37_03105 [Ktedonobacteraceae bacterium]|jgi:hypothetical protein|nr:hypothetical protein [Ktedonobacteraceae bacterium]